MEKFQRSEKDENSFQIQPAEIAPAALQSKIHIEKMADDEPKYKEITPKRSEDGGGKMSPKPKHSGERIHTANQEFREPLPDLKAPDSGEGETINQQRDLLSGRDPPMEGEPIVDFPPPE